MKNAAALLAALTLTFLARHPAKAQQPAPPETPRPEPAARPADAAATPAARPAARRPEGDQEADARKKKQAEKGKAAPAGATGTSPGPATAAPARPAAPKTRPAKTKKPKAGKKPVRTTKAQPEEKPAVPPIKDEPSPAKRRSRRLWRIGFYTSAALTVAMFTIGGVSMWKVNQLSGDKKRHLLEVYRDDPNAQWVNASNVCTHPDRDSKTDNICNRGKAYAAVAGVGLALGTVALLGTLVTSHYGFFDKAKKKSKKEKEKDEGKGKESSATAGFDLGSGVTLTASPQVSEKGAGILLQLDF